MTLRISAALLAVLFWFTPAAAVDARAVTTIAAALQLFATEDAAQRHCPRDTVVWLNTATGIYHEKGMRWYGRTKHGA